MKKSVVFLLLLGAVVAAHSQSFDLGLLVGGSNYRGDLSANSSKVFLNENHLAGGVFGRYHFNDFVTLRLGFNMGKISGQDANADEEAIRQRNLSFESRIWEVGLTGQFNILGYQPYNYSRPFSPYLFGGVALLGFKPQTSYQGQRVDLAGLGTEGQGMPDRPEPYKLKQLAIPFGLGFQYALTESIGIGLEVGARLALSDYLDDVSGSYVAFDELLAANGPLAAALGNRTGELNNAEPVVTPTGTARGDSVGRDMYFLAGVLVTYQFVDNGLVGTRGRSRGSKRGCKTY